MTSNEIEKELIAGIRCPKCHEYTVAEKSIYGKCFCPECNYVLFQMVSKKSYNYYDHINSKPKEVNNELRYDENE